MTARLRRTTRRGVADPRTEAVHQQGRDQQADGVGRAERRGDVAVVDLAPADVGPRRSFSRIPITWRSM